MWISQAVRLPTRKESYLISPDYRPDEAGQEPPRSGEVHGASHCSQIPAVARHVIPQGVPSGASGSFAGSIGRPVHEELVAGIDEPAEE
jgi:hypothetical protein